MRTARPRRLRPARRGRPGRPPQREPAGRTPRRGSRIRDRLPRGRYPPGGGVSVAPTGRVIVVGASAAGLAAAETLRGQGHTGTITLIGDEPTAPYDRPPLSKEILSGWSPDR